MLNQDTIETLKNLTMFSFPHEICGFILEENEEVFMSKNIAEDTRLNFAISAKDYARAQYKGKIKCIYHSHTNGHTRLSTTDIWASDSTNLPIFVVVPGKRVNPDLDEWYYDYYDPQHIPDYLGRKWIWARQDCYSLFRDWYRKELGILLSPYRRFSGEKIDDSWNRFIENIEREGFVTVGKGSPSDGFKIQKHDMILMSINSKYPNHICVVVDEESNLFLHHLKDRLSEHHIYGGWWREITSHIVRHKSLCG